MKQILTILTTFGAMIVISASASASTPAHGVSNLELGTQSTTSVLNARDALGIVAQCSGGYGNSYYGGGYHRSYVPVRRSYYRGGGGGGLNISVGRNFGGGIPYGYGRGRGFGPGYGGYGRGPSRGFGGSGVGFFLSL